MKTKTFDCVEMKRKAQEALLAEFEARRDEFDTLTEFLAAKAAESDWVSATWARFGGSGVQFAPRREKNERTQRKDG